MDETRMLIARKYYERVGAGEDKGEVAKDLMGTKKDVVRIENSDEYLAIVSAASQLEKEELKRDIEVLKRKQIKSYSDLLDKGEQLMAEADDFKDKLAAQANQRANLGTDVIDKALAWDGEDRNKNDLGDVLEGVIV